ncbi:hypothetical protein [Actinotalea subterranea]|uniref:hypothetical protein n=1 Tax=Actinotalea subterranea TaxID=2607497 RepID=UPI0011ED0A00|nr:hypothetical protein [Actinotalea subterranea]
MSARPRRFARTAVLTFAFLVPTVLVAGSPAQAVACNYAGYITYSGDYARTTDVSGGCTQVAARHYYDPVWSSNNYYSSWKYGGDVAQSTAAAELISGQHTGY